MNSFFGIGIIAAIVYAILIDFTYFKIYFAVLIAYIVLTQIGTLNRYNNPRKKCNIATWNGKFVTSHFCPRSQLSSGSCHL